MDNMEGFEGRDKMYASIRSTLVCLGGQAVLAMSILMASWSLTAAGAEVAVSCQFELLMQAHEALVHCGEQIATSDEQRYVQIRDQFAQFIRTNQVAPGARHLRDESQIRRELHNKSREEVCRGAAYILLRRQFYEAVSDAGVDAIRRFLARPRDPDAGDCL
jgi:hypothetical protein